MRTFSTFSHNNARVLASFFLSFFLVVKMVRTKADSVPGSYRKAVAASAPRKSLGSSAPNAASSSSSAKNKYAGGNPVCVRPTPTWQKGIGDFFGGPGRKPEKENRKPGEERDADDREAGGSGVSETGKKSRPLPAEEEDE
ncbi:PCNA-associated factor isoform X2 [Phycodurus eques]|uniref:PCNA-associated factor isoform X2 n=1 Tax=Phycodurus eques TaxID=693459 RepID=UPI002ACDEDC0|nr:PCNA-associated factor isoform X2 [Phycodurus eques]